MVRRRAVERADPPRAAQLRSSPARARRPIIHATVAAVLVIGAAAWWWNGHRTATSPVPALPDLTGHPTAVREHLEARHAAALATPTTTTIGALCLALHADMFFDAADRCYTAARHLDPTTLPAPYLQSLIQADRGGGAPLVESLQHIVDQHPDFAPAWLRLGDAAFKLGDYDRAAAAWGRAAALPEPTHDSATPPHVAEAPLAAYATFGIARIAMARGDVDAAGSILREIVTNVPDFGPAWRLLGEAYEARGLMSEAARAVKTADRLASFAPYADPFVDQLARESRNSTFLLRLSSEASLGANAAWSEYLARRALASDPDNPEVLSKLGRILRTLGRNEEALQYFRRYNALVPGDYQGLAHTGSCLSALGQYEEAEALLRRALPHLDDATTHYNLGLLLARTGRGDEAEREYRVALDRDPSQADARINLATTLARRGRVADAERELRHVLSDDPGNELARRNLAALRP